MKAKRIPRPVNKLGGLVVFAKRDMDNAMNMPLQEWRQKSACTAYYLALNAMIGGYANSQHFNTVAEALNLGRVLAEQYKGLPSPEIKQALLALARCKDRHTEHGKYGLDGEGITALRAMGALHEAQFKVATLVELDHAEAVMHQRITAGNVFNTKEQACPT